VCPTGAYSVCASPVLIERVTTSPVVAPMRASKGFPPSATTLFEYRFSSRCMRSAACSARCGWSSCAMGAPNIAKDAVPGGLGDVAAVVVHRIYHQLERRIGDCPRFFGVEVLFQLGRAPDIGGEHGDGLALALDCGISGSGIYLYGRARIGFSHRTLKRLCAFEAKLRRRGILGVARRASTRERRSAFDAEFRSVGTFSSALRAAHGGCQGPPSLARRFRLGTSQRPSQRLDFRPRDRPSCRGPDPRDRRERWRCLVPR
jgi:hypothetical protein